MTIDLEFRPTSYADFTDPVALALNGVLGQQRREMIRDMLTARGDARELYDELLGSLEPGLLGEEAEAGFVHTLSSLMGPWWMGGEFLPPLLPGEVEIARVILASSTMDVISLRAWWTGNGYHYRMVDEYEGKFTLCRETSPEPLRLREVIELLETADEGGAMGGRGMVRAWWHHQWDGGDDPEACTDFAWVESELYPHLSLWYQELAESWQAERRGETQAGPGGGKATPH
jgi:hypothetical protein